MPRQNRVTPFGDLIATPARGTLMGNRGCLHDTDGRIRRPYVGKRWIICVLEFKGRRRRVMAPGRYTELFFLDEATALAAGHRPCAECQRERYLEFREHWMAARRSTGAGGALSADDLDNVLHAERVATGPRRRPYVEQWLRLPDGVMVAEDAARSYLVHAGRLFPWTPSGYGPPRSTSPAALLRLLTPRSVVAAMRHGYRPQLHRSATWSRTLTRRDDFLPMADALSRGAPRRGPRRGPCRPAVAPLVSTETPVSRNRHIV